MIDLLVLALSTIIAIMGFFIKRVFNRVDKMETALQEHLVTDVEKYATKAELKTTVDDFKDFIKEIIEPINRKMESIEVHLRKDV